MQVSVELVFDARSESRIRALSAHLAEIYGGPNVTELGVRPHISLTSFPAGEPSGLREALERLAQKVPPFSLSFASVQSFPTSEGVVYLEPVFSEALVSCHQMFHTLAQQFPESRNPYYEPGRWVPHCTVATDVPGSLREKIIVLCRQSLDHLEVEVGCVAATQYRPARELYSAPFKGGGSAGLRFGSGTLRSHGK